MPTKNHWILEVMAALFIVMVVCLLGAAFVQGLHQENVCWRNGYQTPVNYAGSVYCFGRDGEPEVVALAELPAE